MSLKSLINEGNIDGINLALKKDTSLSNKIIKWGPLLKNKVHPLHYLCDRVFANKLEDKTAAEIARNLVNHGANINGYGYQEMEDTPLIAATSLGADGVALVLIEAGADIHHKGCLGGTALHWGAWCGRDTVVKRLLEEKIDLNIRDITHKSTVFFWAAHGRARGGEQNQHKQIACAKMIKDAGADTSIPNAEGTTVAELMKDDKEFMDSVFD